MKCMFWQFLTTVFLLMPMYAEQSPDDLRKEARKIRQESDRLKVLAMNLEGKAKVFESEEQIKECLAKMVAVKPQKARKLLVYSRTTGFRHKSIPMGVAVLTRLGKETGAFEVTATEDGAFFTDEKLAEFDAVLMLSTTGKPIPKAGHAAFEKFLASGKGLIGIHAATDCHREWENYLEAIGGLFDGHPWGGGDTVTLFNEDPQHPCCKNIPQGFQIRDEIYQYRNDKHFTRDKLRILLSLDLSGPNMKKSNMKRQDHDYAVSWVREYSKSRVFYTNLGHNDTTFINAIALQHILAGIQYALGDIQADATPSAKLGKKPKDPPPGF